MDKNAMSMLATNPEYAPQIQGIDRQRKMAEMLITQGFQPQQGQMVSGRYVAPSWTQQLAGLANIWAGKGMQEEAEKKQIDLAKALRGETAESMRKFAMAETPQERFNIAASDPNLHQFLPEMMKNVSVKKDEIIYSPITGKALYEGKPDLPSNVQEAIIYKNLPPNPKDWTPEQRALAEATNLTHRKAGASSVVLPPAESEYVKTFGAGLAKQDLALRDIASNAPQAIASIQNQRKLLDSGKVITGIGANQRLDLARLGSEIGVGGRDVKELTSNTQQLMAGRAGATLDAIKASGLGSGTGFSNADRDFLEKAKMGGITYDKTALQKQLALEEKVARIGANQWNERLKTMPKSAGVVNPQTIQLPPEIGTTDVRSKADAIINQGQ